MKTLIAILIFFSPLMILAHGVHDSGSAKPQKGGVLISLETVHLELVQMGGEIRVYVYNKDTPPKAADVSKYPVSAKAVLPRNKGSEDLTLTPKGDHWTTSFDAKGSHRYDFILSIEQGGHKDNVSFTIEPKN